LKRKKWQEFFPTSFKRKSNGVVSNAFEKPNRAGKTFP
jgi:hypothetical protein